MKETDVKIEEPVPYMDKCVACGETLEAHEDSRPADAPRPRVPCLLLKEHFIKPVVSEDRKAEGEKDKGGRPTIYTNDLADEICARIAAGESLRQICKNPEMPNASSVYLWLMDDGKKRFSNNYAMARAAQAENMFEEIVEIADDGSNDYTERMVGDGVSVEVVNHEHIQRSRLRIDTRKWYMSKVLPKKFGDKVDLTSAGEKLGVAVLGSIPTEDEKVEDVTPDDAILPDLSNEESSIAP